jgi:CheY-like chemotaxis protein
MPRVLVVEDEPLIAGMVQDWLTELGCKTVGPAASVPKALELIKDGALDGAILDVSLGGHDCTPVADVLRMQGVPFAFSTGHSVSGLTGRYPGALSLPKPYDFAAVRGVVEQLLAAKALAAPPAQL